MIVLRSPKGWTGPKEIKGHKVEGSWRSHQVPFSDVRGNPENLKLLEDLVEELRAGEAVRRRRGGSCPSSRRWRPRARVA